MANRFEQEITKSHKQLGWYSIKVPVASKQGISFLNNAPFDFIAVYQGVPYSFEAKMCKNKATSFPLSRLEYHQIENLLAFSAVGGRAYIVISFRKPKLTAYAVEINDWREISKELIQQYKRKSVPRSWFDVDSRFISIPRFKDSGVYYWDFNEIAKHGGH